MNRERERQICYSVWCPSANLRTTRGKMASAKSSAKGEFHVGGKYRLVRKIGSGSFGDIYLAMNIANGEVGIAQ